MSGNIDSAAQLIMHRQEAGQSLQPNDFKAKSKGKHDSKVDDKSIKSRIMDKYGFIDQADDSRYHRPTLKREVIITIWTFN